MRKPSKAMRAAFAREITALFAAEGAVKVDDVFHTLELQTIVGVLQIRVDGDWLTVFGRFVDIEAAREIVDINPHSGKWNHHYAHWMSVPDAVENLKREISRLKVVSV
jgi:hypothetical protein